MITKIKIDGFKTFRGFEMEFSPLTVIAGANASGKSNLFDALQLLSKLVETDLRTAFREQRGEPFELFMQYGDDWYADEMRFEVEFLLNKEIRDNWGREATLKYTRLRYTLTLQRCKNENGFEDLYVVNEHLAPLRRKNDPWGDSYLADDVQDFWRPKVSGGRSQDFIETSEKAIILRQDGRNGNKKEHPLGKISQTILSSVN